MGVGKPRRAPRPRCCCGCPGACRVPAGCGTAGMVLTPHLEGGPGGGRPKCERGRGCGGRAGGFGVPFMEGFVPLLGCVLGFRS